jgi:hypothetical protein
MTTNELLMLLTGIALSCAVFALVFIIYPRLRPAGANIVQAAVEAALQPLIHQAILAAYRLSEKTIDQGNARLRGADKKQLADDAYALLPERVGQYDITFIKSLVPRERFEALVQNAFDQFDRFYLTNHAHFDDEFQKWAEKNKPAAPVADGATAAHPIG